MKNLKFRPLRLIRLFALLLLIMPLLVYSQSSDDSWESIELTKEAVKLIRDNRLSEAMKKLKEAQKLDGENFAADYWIAKIHFKKGEYQKSLDIMERIMKGSHKEDVMYQLLGNSYYRLGQKEKAMEIYKKGLSDFPYSGAIHFELGNADNESGNTTGAFRNYEYGIRFDPEYSDNYYSASKMLLKEGNHWGIIYGEIYLNMEPYTVEWKEMSKLMYDTYKMKFTGTESPVDPANLLVSDTAKTPFDAAYLAALEPSLKNNTSEPFSLYILNDIRKKFIEYWLENGSDSKFPNALFTFQKRMLDDGYFELYNYYMFSEGADDEYSVYYDNHTSNIKSFKKWWRKNYLTMTNKNSIYRSFYR
jgi:tetratricopeptide (TPR) repeat protein